MAKDGNKMMLACAVHGDVPFNEHLGVLVIVFEKRYLRLIQGIQSLKCFMYVHFGDAHGGAFQGVICQIKSHDLHYFRKLFGDKLHLFPIS